MPCKTGQYIQIPKGSTPRRLSTTYRRRCFGKRISNACLPAHFSGDASKAKSRRIPNRSPITPLQVLQDLEKGEERTSKLTIPEGFTRFDIAKRIVEKFPQIRRWMKKPVLI